MTRAEWEKFLTKTLEQIREVLLQKNHDYSDEDDCFSNFRGAERYGVRPIVGVLMRHDDKTCRIQTWLNSGKLAVEGEGVEDALFDRIGYNCIALGLLHESKLQGDDALTPQQGDARLWDDPMLQRLRLRYWQEVGDALKDELYGGIGDGPL